MQIDITEKEQGLILALISQVIIKPLDPNAQDTLSTINSLNSKLNANGHVGKPAENAGQ